LKLTVCEFHDDAEGLAHDWAQLVAHVKAEASDLVLLPETPFHPWFAGAQPFEAAVWRSALAAHVLWQPRFNELAPAIVLGTRPVGRDNRRLNEGFVWEARGGYRVAHHKHYFPNEAGFWETSWYQRGDGDFAAVTGNSLSIGFLICTELWFMERARAYGKAGAHLIVNPRATEAATTDKWLAAGRTAAVISGAYALSSNRVSMQDQTPIFGGQGWVVSPDGKVLALTSPEHPVVTVEIDPSEAERAKRTYPRYLLD
jgi:N-carbamoylputrescine amidase